MASVFVPKVTKYLSLYRRKNCQTFESINFWIIRFDNNLQYVIDFHSFKNKVNVKSMLFCPFFRLNKFLH